MGARFARAQPRARPCNARQSILLIKEILFDYLITSVAQKLADLAQIEVRAKLFKNGGVSILKWEKNRLGEVVKEAFSSGVA